MAVIISNGNTDLHTASGFYRVEAGNYSPYNTTTLALTSTRTISVTFANSGNCQGVVLSLITTAETTRDVTVVLKESGTIRATATLTAAQICNSTISTIGCWLIPFVFSAPYAITTAAGVWTLEISQGAGTNNWAIGTSNGTAPFYAAWCDNAVSFADNDTIICKDIVTVTQNATIKGSLGTGDTTWATAVYVCRSSTPPTLTNNVINFQLQAGASTTTVTIDGGIAMSAHGGVQIGTQASPIPYANMCTLHWKSPTIGTRQYISVANGNNYSRTSLMCWGEYPTTDKFETTAATANGASKVVVADTTGISPGDKFFISKETSLTSGIVQYYTCTSTTATDINITPNMVRSREAGGYAWRVNGYGITWSRETYANTDFRFGLVSNMTFVGVSLFIESTGTGPAMNGHYVSTGQSQDAAAHRSQFLFSHCVKGYSSGILYNGYLSPEGAKAEFTYSFGCGTYWDLRRLDTYDNAIVYEHDNFSGYNFGSPRLTAASAPVQFDIQRNIYECFAAGYIYGTDLVYKDNWHRGGTSSGFQIYTSNLYNAKDWSNNTYDSCPTTIKMQNANINITMRNEKQIGTGFTSHIKIDPSALVVDVTMENPDFVPLFNNTDRLKWIEGSRFAVTNEDEVPNAEYSHLRGGTITKTGASLPDTTVRTSGGFAMRFEPTDTTALNLMSWKQIIPTGNIQNKTMTVSVWVYINNAAYYAGTHTKPTLTVDYDNGTEISSVATATAGSWQQLAVTFTPTTGYGQVEMKVTGATDATGTDSYFYVDDMNVAYPAGVAIDLGNLDLWAEGLPVAPAIATMPSLGGVWDEPLTAHTIAGSAGRVLTDAANDQKLPNLLIKDKLS